MYARYVVIWLPSYGVKKDSLKKKLPKGSNSEKESNLCRRHTVLISHIAIKLQDIPYGYLVHAKG